MQIGMFPITLSHLDHEFLCMMGALTFLENVVLYLFTFLVNYGLVTKSFGDACTIQVVLKKIKCHKKKNVNTFTIKLRLIMSPSFQPLRPTHLLIEKEFSFIQVKGLAIFCNYLHTCKKVCASWEGFSSKILKMPKLL